VSDQGDAPNRIRLVTAELVHVMREASGLPMMRCKEIADDARLNLHGDFVTALLAADANTLAVKINSRDPSVSDVVIRRRWNLARALGRRDDMVARHETWARLDAMSNRFRGDPATH